MKFRGWQNKALSFIKAHVTNTLKLTAQQTTAELKQGAPADLSEGSIYYRKFKFAAPKVRSLIQELEARAASEECVFFFAAMLCCANHGGRYQAALVECMHVYFQQRRQLVAPLVQSRVRELAQSSDLHGLLRAGWAYVFQLCAAEHQLCSVFFEKPSAGLNSLLEGFALDLHDVLRPLVLQQHRIEVLCAAVSIIRGELCEEQLDRRAALSPALRPLLMRLQGDVQERLVFMTQAYIRDEIAGFAPAAAHLEYPERLQAAAAAAAAAPVKASAGEHTLRSLGGSWYPTLERTLLVLSKLYLSIEPVVFEGLAQEAVSVCIESLSSAAKTIGSKKVTPRVPKCEQKCNDTHITSKAQLLTAHTNTTPSWNFLGVMN